MLQITFENDKVYNAAQSTVTTTTQDDLRKRYNS
ncbi:MAG: hypothetical protein CM15mP122_5660 [Bacteroidota bacterium]|nr:MAG: hypothetical protein CM15mP122_5660 [Bacteroidota bacterium]